jgi:uncharacterized protein HemX
LRHDIDHGRTGDKVDWPDPAAAPLGTDDEAGASQTPSPIVESARAAERTGPIARPQRTSGLGAAWILIGFVLMVAVGFVLWMLVQAA